MTNQPYHPNDAVSSPRYVNGTPDWVKPIIDKASQAHNIPSVLLSALIKQESGFNPQAQSKAGAIGIAQFMPSTAQGRGVDPWDPSSAIMGAAQYLRQGLDKYGGDTKKALAAYNAGFGNVDKFGGVPPFKETQNYVKNILSMSGEPHQSFNGPQVDIVQEAQKQAQKPGQVTGRREGVPVQAMYKSPPPVQINDWRDAIKQFLFPRVPPPEQMMKPQDQYQEGYSGGPQQTVASAPDSPERSTPTPYSAQIPNSQTPATGANPINIGTQSVNGMPKWSPDWLEKNQA